MNISKRLLIALALCLTACSDPGGSVDSDGGTEDSGGEPDMATTDGDVEADAETDFGPEPDAELDASDSDCVQVSLTAFDAASLDDVSVEYTAPLSGEIDDRDRSLAILFERYGDAEYRGTFELGAGRDENFGNCAHCVYIRGNNPEQAYYADRGQLTVNEDPFSRRLDIEVEDLRLVKVAVDPFTRESAPIPGTCVEVADFAATGIFPPPGWSCPDEQYGDGEACHCECGTYDSDCGGAITCLPGDPACTPRDELPVVGCSDEEVCVFDPVGMQDECTEPCDWLARESCDSGVCVFDFGVGQGDLCLAAAGPRVSPDVAIGEECPGGNLQVLCNVVDGFAEGFCGPNGPCRAICETDEECTEADHTCRKFVSDGPLGYCGPEPVDDGG